MISSERDAAQLARLSYKDYGTTALIFEDGKAICTAKFEDGQWSCNYQRQVNETSLSRQSLERYSHVSGTLDGIVWEMMVRGHGEWRGREYDPNLVYPGAWTPRA